MNTLGNNNKHRHLTKLAFSAGCVCLALAFALSLVGGVAHAAPLAVTVPGLGSASNFAVLSAAPDHGGAVTCTRSTINGDVGSSGYRPSVTKTGCKINGVIVAPVADQVVADFLSAYSKYAAMECGDQVLTGSLAGVELEPGVYCVSAEAKTGELTLNGPADGVWIFLVNGALTGTDFSVVMAGDGQPCNVYWWVAEAATMTTSDFVGTILAGAAITINYGTFTGDALARAAVTMTGTTLVSCEASGGGGGNSHSKCNQGVGNGPETCDPGNSNQGNPSRSNDELGGTPGHPGRKGGNVK